MSRRLVALLALWLLIPLAAAETRPLTADGYRELLAGWKGQPRLVVLWSIDCPPCHDELAMLGRLYAQTPRMPLTLICTDNELPAAELNATLARHGLRGAESFQFADPVPARLRQAIDPGWYGELPRSYLIDVGGQHLAHSGLLPEAPIRDWLRAQATPAE